MLTVIDTTVSQVTLPTSRTRRIDLRGARVQGLESNPEGLKGVTLGSDQVTELAPVLADILGIKVV